MRHPSATTLRLVASLPAPQTGTGLQSCVGQDQATKQLHGLSGHAGTWRAGLSFIHLACICLPAHQQGNNNPDFVAKAAGSARCLSDGALKNLIFSKRERGEAGMTPLASCEEREAQGNSGICLNELEVRVQNRFRDN